MWTVKNDIVGGVRMYWRHDVYRNKRISDPMTESEVIAYCEKSQEPSAKAFLEFFNGVKNSYIPKKD